MRATRGASWVPGRKVAYYTGFTGTGKRPLSRPERRGSVFAIDSYDTAADAAQDFIADGIQAGGKIVCGDCRCALPSQEDHRSEERRVGKGCRCREVPDAE